MAATDLTTLANVLAWIPSSGNVTGPSQQTNAVIQRLITQLSQMMLDAMQRGPFYSRPYTDTSDGQGTPVEFLDQWPVTSIASVVVNGINIPPAPPLGNAPVFMGTYPSSGYRFTAWDGTLPGQPQPVELVAQRFPRGRQNISITYQAGYLVANEAQTVPATPFTVTPDAPFGAWCFDNGVTYADTGLPLTAVAANPAEGQYVPPLPQGTNPNLSYQFNEADSGVPVLLSYSFIPNTIEDACINWVSERYAMRSRIGVKTQSLGGQEAFSYDRSPVPAYIMAQIQPYCRVLPT